MTQQRLTCPSCSETEALRRSHARWFDLLQLLFQRRAYRCQMCNRRFYAHKGPHLHTDQARKAAS